MPSSSCPSYPAKRLNSRANIKKPAWLKLKWTQPNSRYQKILAASETAGLATVCKEAMCPNIGECWGSGTATFMIMGGTCTRACRFCNVNHGKPEALDPDEPQKLSQAVGKLGLDYTVITSVDRDDLADCGAKHFAECIKRLRDDYPDLIIEVLTPDFKGKKTAIQKIIEAGPHVFGHNIETVKRLQRQVRDFRAGYDQSIEVLDYVKKTAPGIFTKSSIMVGLGETKGEVCEAMRDLRSAGVDLLTIGQYLRPSAWNFCVTEYITPDRFEWYRKKGLEMGFKHVASGPFVRSSYKAGETWVKLHIKS